MTHISLLVIYFELITAAILGLFTRYDLRKQ